MLSPLQAARAYDKQREAVMATSPRTRRHSRALAKLSECARLLHEAERRAGIPMGSTRELNAQDRAGAIRA